MISFENTSPVIGEADAENFRKITGVEIPDDLKNHFLKYNGGRPIPSCFENDVDKFCIRSFLVIAYGDENYSLESTYLDLKSNDLFPSGYLPFAMDEGGDYFLYSMRNDFGSIYFNQSEYYEEPDRFMIKLSDNFGKFLNSLKDCDGAVKANW